MLSDALETLINLAAGVFALTAITISNRPADDEHTYGHNKVEYFSSGAEGILILVAAFGVFWTSIHRFFNPLEVSNLGWGLGAALVAAGVNWITAIVMLRAGRKFDSITLEADARHLLTDVWTSGGLVLGLGIMLIKPEWSIIDPTIGVLMGVNIAWAGVRLIQRSTSGLMDEALPEEEVQIIAETIRETAAAEAIKPTTFHALRTRKSGNKRFIDFHFLVPGNTPVKPSHDLCCRIEDNIKAKLSNCQITIHVEPLEDYNSYDGHVTGGTCDRKTGGKGHGHCAG